MPKKMLLPGARWGDPASLTETDWRELEAAAGVTFSGAHRERIKAAVAAYSDWATLHRRSPRLSAVRPVLEEAARKANDFGSYRIPGW